jgi:2,4-dienoyl-CoA reductase-like NADH-dependent reductase (Old Yellow Enzyme family)
MVDLFDEMTFTRGPAMKNRFMLAPLTNSQSHVDGTLSEDEFNWLTYRATGGFAHVMTACAHVQAVGQGFPGQLGVFSDKHLPELTRLAAKIREEGAVSSVQLYHAGNRAPANLIGGQPRGPSGEEDSGTRDVTRGQITDLGGPEDHMEVPPRAMTLAEVEELVEDFIVAAIRCETAGFDGVELHGAHGYIITAFLSSELNRRTDRYGGSLENRMRFLKEIIAGIRARTNPNFQLGLRISAERFSLKLADQLEIARQMLTSGDLDYLDVSLWDCFKMPEEEEFAGKMLIDWFAEIPRGNTRLGVAGKLMSADDCRRVLDHGVDFVLLGRGAILHHDMPNLIKADPNFTSIANPVTRDHLRKERLGEAFIDYMATWKGFVVEEETEDA